MTEKRVIRCGFCLTGDHKLCATTLESGNHLWHCGCTCRTSGKYSPEHPRTRCIKCYRRDVEVDRQSRCTDTYACQGYIDAQKKKGNRVMAELVQERGESRKRSATLRGVTEVRASVQRVGECLCCGAETRGGKFLPGHDSRFISEVAAKVAMGDKELLDRVKPQLSTALQLKLAKRIEAVLKELNGA